MKKTKQRQKNVDSPVNNTKKDSDELEYALNVLDRVDMWIGSCDNKLGILIGIIGVVLTICITSDSVNSFLVFIKNLYVRVEGSKDIQATFFLFLVVIAVVLWALAAYFLVKALFVRINTEDFKQEQLHNESNIFFGSISARKYKDFKKSFLSQTNDDKISDVLSQIFINSNIAQIKHKYYNKGLFIVIIASLFTVVLFLLVSIL